LSDVTDYLFVVSARTNKRSSSLEVGVWRDEEVVVVGDVVRVFFARARVLGDVDPHGGGLGACEADGGAIVIEVRASALFVCLGGRVEDAHSCEIVRCLAMRQYLKQTEEVSTDSP
jgi:hypothetical protein